MTKDEALKILRHEMQTHIASEVDLHIAMAMAIEALKAKCPTCKRCSDHQESGTRCPIEEHYALPKDGFCHLYEPYKAESEEEE